MKTISHPRPWKMKAPQVNWQEDSSQTNSVPQPKFRVTHPPMPPNAQDGSKVVMQAIVKWFEDQDQIKLLKMASRGQIRSNRCPNPHILPTNSRCFSDVNQRAEWQQYTHWGSSTWHHTQNPYWKTLQQTPRMPPNPQHQETPRNVQRGQMK